MANHPHHLLNTQNHMRLTGFFVFCLIIAAGLIGCSDSGGKKKTGYHLTGYQGVYAPPSSKSGNENLAFYAEFPWFVNLTYQVLNEDQKGIPGLSKDNFIVKENGQTVSPQDSEMSIHQRTTLPQGYTYTLKTVVLVDNSTSVAAEFEKIKECTQVFIDNMDLSQQQQIAILAYNAAGDPVVVQNFTNQAASLTQAIAGLKIVSGTSNFYGAVIDSLSMWEDQLFLWNQNTGMASKNLTQGFLVAITDGRDTSQINTFSDVIRARNDKMVITVAVGDLSSESSANLKALGNAGFYTISKQSDLCANLQTAQNWILSYVDGFYWLRYKTKITGADTQTTHPVSLTVVNNGNKGSDGQISGSFNSKGLFSGNAGVYFDASADDPDGITQKTILVERGQPVGSVVQKIEATTYSQTNYQPSQYTWTSSNTSVIKVGFSNATSSKANLTVMAPGETDLTAVDTANNNVSRTIRVTVSVRKESLEMVPHVVTSMPPWYVDATFQVRKTNPTANQWIWVPDLTREDMSILENNDIIDFETAEAHLRKRDSLPSNYSYTMKTVLVIDNSPSNRNIDNLPLLKEAAKAFAKRALVNDPKDNSDPGPLLNVIGQNQQQIAVVSFDENGNKKIILNFTSNLQAVNTAIDGIVKGYGPISFYGAMIDALNLWSNDHHPYDNNTAFVQGMVIVISDGWDSMDGFYSKDSVIEEREDRLVICVGVGDDIVSSNSDDLGLFGNAGYYSVPDPGKQITVKITSDDGKSSSSITYTILSQTLMNIQNVVYNYANSFYWFNYKSYLPPAPDCNKPETVVISVNNNSNIGITRNVTDHFDSCKFFEGEENKIYINSTVTDPDGIDAVNLSFTILGDIPLYSSIASLEAFTFKHSRTPDYEWRIDNTNIVRVTPNVNSYAKSRAVLSLPDVKREGTAFLQVIDHGNNGVFKNMTVNVDGTYLPAPIAYYPFNGNAKDETGNGYDGKVSGATLTSDRFGKANSAYSFNGTSDYIALEDLYYGADAGAYSDHINEITVCSWFKTGYDPGSNEYWGRIVDFDGSNYYQILMNNAGHIVFNTNSGVEDWDYTYPIETEDAYNDNVWHFLCAVYGAGGKKSIYVDGVLMAQIDVPPGQPIGTGATKSGFIGSHYLLETPPKYWYFNGQIDDVIIFDAELTSAQIERLWQSFK